MVQFVASHPELYMTTFEMCQYGLVMPGPDGDPMPIRKSTRVLTSSARLAQALIMRCTSDHKHLPLEGGHKCADAQVYSPEFCNVVVKAFAQQLKDDMGASGRDQELHFCETSCIY